MVLFGGRKQAVFGEKVLNDTWLLDLESHTWSKVTTRQKPPPRLTPGMIIDPESRQLILFGGLGKDQRFGDTWIFNLETLSWEEITPSRSPSARSDVGMTLAEEQRRVLLYGGYCQEIYSQKCAETWEFNLDSHQWTRLATAGSPPMTYGLQLVYDPLSQQFLQWGGHKAGKKDGVYQSLGYSDVLWSYSPELADWVVVDGTGSRSPQARYWHHLVWAPDIPGILLFGGDGGQGFLNDTWVYRPEENIWKRINRELSPTPRVNASMAYDSYRDQLVLFGGLGEGFQVFGDLWIFSPSTSSWNRIAP
jgi:N-acetylneuraminic acid mutarotase